MSSLWRLIYTSRRTCSDAGAAALELAAIQAVAGINNQRQGLAGALVASASRFAQVLEGPRDALERCFERITSDPRHDDLLVMWFAQAETPAFADFLLALTSFDEATLADPDTAGDAMLAQLRAAMSRLEFADGAASR
jgi:hypothetical protein